jgi:phospholipid/cholesterol/gamma-HCH transport system substrate-binding protein
VVNEEGQERRQKLKVGVFVLIGLVAFLGMIYSLGARARLFEPRYTIHAEFNEVGGLVEGATVRLAGVQIGRVTGVRLPAEPGGKVRVDLTIGRQFASRVRKDSVARIETQGLLGDKIIELSVGTVAAAAVKAGDTIDSQEPQDIGRVMAQSGQVIKSVSVLAESLRETAQKLNQSGLIEEAAATVTSARKVTDRVGRVIAEVERGKGWAHVLVYEEPAALRRLNEVIASTQSVLERVQRGEGAAGVLVSPESTASAKRFVAALDRLSRVVEQPSPEDGVLPALLFDPKYRALLDDVRVVAHNMRDISDRLAGGRGTLGSLLKDEPGDSGLGQASQDFQATMANFRAISEKINTGEGTVGALIADPTVYERLVTILDGAQRSFLLRSMIRSLGKDGDASKASKNGKE